jgi:multidrug resistance efflux pump
MKRVVRLILLLGIVAGIAYYYSMQKPPSVLTLTGIVTTNDVIVSSQIAGRIDQLLVNEGDAVKRDQMLAVMQPDELMADRSYYEHSVEGLSSQVQESEAALRYQQRQTVDQISQAEATLAATIAQQGEAAANLENAKINLERSEALMNQGVAPQQQYDQSRTAYDAAKARVETTNKQIDAQKAALALARSNAEQIQVRRSQVAANQQQRSAVAAQRTKAEVRLSYSEIRAPIDGIVDVRAARPGEVVNAGQPVVTLINPDDLWVRADIEETYIDRVRIGDQFTVRLPSGEERRGTVFYRAPDAGFATQRDVSRTKRDIKTFEIRLRIDNADRRLAVGLTAYVLLPVAPVQEGP